MSRPLICLTMILKDEAHCIRRTLDSVKGFIDQYVALDTGSTDGTQAIVREVMQGIPGKLYEEPFVDFATSRNRVLQLARSLPHAYTPETLDTDSIPVFMLMLSADEVLSGGYELRAFLEAHRDADDGAYSITMMSERSRWFYPRILRVDAGWTYTGAVHEVPLGPNGESHGPVVPGVTVTHDATDPERRLKRMREFDLPTLTEMVEDETQSLAARAQAVWFLAQTYDGLSDGIERTVGGVWITYKMMAMSLYWRRTEIGGAMGEANDTLKTHYALLRYMNVAETIGFYNDEEMLTRLNALVEMEPRIPEVHYMIAVHAAKLDVRQGLFFAEQAARAAKETLEGAAYHLPTDTRLEWLALNIGAACAKRLDRFSYARELASQAVAAGGPLAMFEEYLSLQDAPELTVGEGDTDMSITETSSDILQVPETSKN